MKKKDYYSNSQEYINRWIISYADFITMLLALFMVLYAIVQMDKGGFKDFKSSLNSAFDITRIKTIDQKKNLDNQQKINEDIKNQLSNLDKMLKKETAEFDNIQTRIKSQSELSKNVNISRETRGLIIRLNDAVLFDPGSDIIKTDARLTLDKLAGILKDVPNSIRLKVILIIHL